MLNQLKTGSLFNFSTINAAILGGSYEKAKVLGSVDYSLALGLDPNIDTRQASLIPFLPTNTPIRHTGYSYYIFQLQTGERVVLASEWINETSVKEATELSVSVEIIGATDSDFKSIKAALSRAGFNSVRIIL